MTVLYSCNYSDGKTTSFGVTLATSVASSVADSRGAGAAPSMGCVVFDTLSPTAFIILYGLLFAPRSDFGRYWSSNDGVYSTVGAGVPVEAVRGVGGVGAPLSTLS